MNGKDKETKKPPGLKREEEEEEEEEKKVEIAFTTTSEVGREKIKCNW